MNEEKKIIAAEIDLDFITAQAGEWQAAADKAKTAAEAYLTDLETRKAALAEQAAGYKTELSTLTAQRKKLAAKINDLSSRGQIDEAAEADAELEALDKSISTLERKLRLVNAAELKGDTKLYKAAKAAHDAAEAERAPYRAKIDAMQQIIKAELDRLESMQRELHYARDRDPGYIANSVFEKVNHHYLDIDRLEHEAAEKAAAERKSDGPSMYFNNSKPTAAVDPEIIAEREAREKQKKERAAAIRKQNETANNSDGERHYVLA